MINKLIILLLIVGVCYASDPSISLTEFGGGLNTNSSVLFLKPNQGSQCLNLDIGRGYLQKRRGYMRLLPTGAWPSGDTLAGNDPTTGLFSFRRSDGQRRLIVVAADSNNASDLDGVGWLLASPSYDLGGSGAYYYPREGELYRYYKYVYQGETPFWTYWNDRVYLSNGRQRPLAFYPYKFESSDGYARELVPLTPGEPLIVPMDVSGNLNGEYYYMIGHSSACGCAYGANVVDTADFEKWAGAADTGSLPSGWDTLSGTTGYIAKESDSVKNGTYAVRLLSRNYNPFNGAYQPGIRQTIWASRDSSYQLSVWFNKKSGNGSYLNIKILDTINGTYLAGYSTYFDDFSQKGYRNLLLSVTNWGHRDSVELEFKFWTLFGQDTVYIDSVTMKSVSYDRRSTVTKPVIAQDENVLLTHFPWQTMADTCTYGSAGFDDLYMDIFRTKANPGEITLEDKFYRLAQIHLTNPTQIDTLHFVDTLADDSLGVGSYITYITIDTNAIGRDSSGTLNGIRIGAPTYIDKNDGVHGVNYIFTMPTASFEYVNKISYICTYYDTLAKVESDSSRSLHIFHNAATDSIYKIGLPPLPGGKKHLTRRLYKSYSYIVKQPKDSIGSIRDTTLTLTSDNEWEVQNFIQNLRDRGLELAFESPTRNPRTYHIKYISMVASVDSISDTTITVYKLIGEMKGTDSVFVDSIKFDSTMKGTPYLTSEAPYNLNYITSFNDRLWGAVGSCVYWSYLDSGGYWGSFRNICLNIDDGDEITAILPMRDYVKVYKNKSQYAIYPGNDFEYERQWTVDGLGCIAPHTALSYQNGVFYLSEQGLIHETGSVYRDRGSDFGNVSEPINNLLLNRTRDALRKAVGFVHKDKYRLSFPASDTTFVYDLKTGGWSIWNYAFAQACLYDTLTINDKNNTPSGDMIFINGETDQIYKADTTSTDNTLIGGTGGTVINTRFRSAPFAMAPDYMTVSKFGIWRQSNDGSGGVDVRLYNAESDSIFYKYMSSIATRYDIYRSNSDASNYFQIDISDTTLDSLAIDRIDLWLEKIGDQPEN